MRSIHSLGLSMVIATIISCSGNTDKQKMDSSDLNGSADPHSYAMPEEVTLTHLDLKLKVDFDKKELFGEAIWSINNKAKTDEIILDSRGLIISKVVLDNEEETFYNLGDEDKFLGQALSIKINPDTKKIKIFYKTGKNAAALQWLSAEQTAGKSVPFLYTQSQAILARSWIPCQDSPAIRFTYTADVEVPKNLLALMSAENPQEKNKDGKYHFEQKHAVPSYLMALAVGNIAFKKTGNITGVYAEPEMIAKVAYEFADMEKMVETAEKLYGKYQWGRYDILVLPPSFPFGGMENPMLTFATPTVIAGDRSLVSLVAHELAHSWSGNLVTNSNWNNFWLNEGFTMYFERRITEEIYGKDEAEMEAVLGYKELMKTIKDMGNTNPDTRLNADFTGRDPDDGVTDIAYEKGYFFLKQIEKTIGREKFDTFLKEYFKKYAFKSVSLAQFEDELEQKIIKNNESLNKKINAYGWIYQPGLPKDFEAPVSKDFSKIDDLQKQLNIKNVKGLNQQLKNTNQKLYFIKTLPDSLSLEMLKAIDTEFDFTNSNNAEIQCAWFTLAIKNNYLQVEKPLENFLIHVGRRKFILPLYEELLKTPQGKIKAKEIYDKARPNYHSVAYHTVDEMMKP